MFLFKRAWLYVKRKWGKALTVGIILFVVSTLSLTGLLIKSASNSTFEVARDKLGADVTYTADLSSAMQNVTGNGGITRGSGGFKITKPDDYTAITTKEIEKIALDSKHVDSYTINASLAGEPVDFSYYNPSGDNNEASNEQDGKFGLTLRSAANINVIGVDKKSKGKDFGEAIVDGRYFTDDEIDKASNVIIIEKTIADQNNIKVGDSITIKKMDQRRMVTSPDSVDSANDIDIAYQVIGIYKTSNPTDVSSTDFRGSFNLPENTMYAPYTSILASSLSGLTGDELAQAQTDIQTNGYTVQSATFTLKNPTDTEAFINEVKSMSGIDTKYRALNANDAAYQQMVGPIENVASTSTALVIVVIVAGSFIIGLLSMLSIKDRKYELGVLLSLGEARFKIVMQLISEMFIVAVISFSLAAIVSNFTAQATTNMLLNQAITASQDEQNNNGGNMGKGGLRGFIIGQPTTAQLKNIDVQTIDALTIGLNITDVLKMFGIGILIIVVGNVLQAMFVLRCNPKEILLER